MVLQLVNAICPIALDCLHFIVVNYLWFDPMGQTYNIEDNLASLAIVLLQCIAVYIWYPSRLCVTPYRTWIINAWLTSSNYGLKRDFYYRLVAGDV